MSDEASAFTESDPNAEQPAPEPLPAPPPVLQAAPRPLDQIHQDLLAAKAKHASDLQAVQDSATALGALTAEFHSALSWFEEQEKTILAGVDELQQAAGGWLNSLIKRI